MYGKHIIYTAQCTVPQSTPHCCTFFVHVIRFITNRKYAFVFIFWVILHQTVITLIQWIKMDKTPLFLLAYDYDLHKALTLVLYRLQQERKGLHWNQKRYICVGTNRNYFSDEILCVRVSFYILDLCFGPEGRFVVWTVCVHTLRSNSSIDAVRWHYVFQITKVHKQNKYRCRVFARLKLFMNLYLSARLRNSKCNSHWFVYLHKASARPLRIKS